MKFASPIVLFAVLAGLLFTFGANPAEAAVGKADMERVFTEFHGTKTFEAEMDGLQQEFMEAQEEGDHMKLMEIQQEFQEKQAKLFEDFHNALEKAAAPVTEKTNVTMIVAEVIFSTEEAEIVDVSEALIDEMNQD